MGKKKEEKQETPVEETVETTETPEVPAINWEEKYSAEHDAHLRLAAEYDNFRNAISRKRKPVTATAKPTPSQKCFPFMTTWNGQ